MSQRKPSELISEEEYLKGEKESPIRHEYVYGYMFAMGGASASHNRIALNIASRLNDHLDGGLCEAFISDMKVFVRRGAYYYPDVVVACDPPGGDAYTRKQPVLVIEVLSDSTSRTDRFEKLPAYRRILSLRECILISQHEMLIDVHRRQQNGQWQTETLNKPEDQLHLESGGPTLSLAQIYRNVRFDQPEQGGD